MTVWAFLAVPLLIFPIVLLFRFLGCGIDNVATGTGPEKPSTPPKYSDTILAEPGLIAYWRLVEDALTTTAKDLVGSKNGEYKTGPAFGKEAPGQVGPGSPGSEKMDGFSFPSPPGLIVTDPQANSRSFDGGHVVVVDPGGLYTDEFTIEAWISKENKWQEDLNYHHVLFSAGGFFPRQLDPTSKNFFQGFTVFANEGGRWELSINGQDSPPSQPRPMVSPGRTHLAVLLKKNVVAGADPFERIWNMYVNGKFAGTGTVSLYLPPNGAPLFIGVGGRDTNQQIPTPRFPIRSRIQEVALYSKALSQEQIQNHFNINK